MGTAAQSDEAEMTGENDVIFEAPLAGWLMEHVGCLPLIPSELLAAPGATRAAPPAGAGASAAAAPQPESASSADCAQAASPFTHIGAHAPAFASLAAEVAAAAGPRLGALSDGEFGLTLPVAPGTAPEQERQLRARRAAPRRAAAEAAAGAAAAAAGGPRRPRAAPLPKTASEEEKAARRRELAQQAQLRFKERRKGELDTLTAEVASKQALLDRLAAENEGLRARERILTRAVTAGEEEMKKLERRLLDVSLSPQEASDSGGAASVGGAAAGSGGAGGGAPIARGGSGSSLGSSGRAAGSSEWPEDSGAAAAPNARSGSDGGADRAWPESGSAGGSTEGGDALAELFEGTGRVADLARNASAALAAVLRLPPNSDLPPEVVVLLRLVYTGFIELGKEAAETPPDDPRRPDAQRDAMAAFKAYANMMRSIQARSPLVRQQLVLLNMETGRREDPPPGFWRSVAARMLRVAMGGVPVQQRVELREAVQLYSAHMAELHTDLEQTEAELSELVATRAACHTDLLSSDGPTLRRYWALLQRMETTLRKQHSLDNLFFWGCEKATPPAIIILVYICSYPFIPAWQQLIQLAADPQMREEARAHLEAARAHAGGGAAGAEPAGAPGGGGAPTAQPVRRSGRCAASSGAAAGGTGGAGGGP